MAAEAELNLNHVPPEVMERIIKYLDLDTIKSLRLTCKMFGERCLGRRFKSFLKQQTTDFHLPSLEQCYLRGIYASEESMLQFLENHPRINQLDLREMTLTSGSWEPIFKHLGSRMPALTRLRLSSLRDENESLRNLNSVWEEGSGAADYSSSYPCGGGLRMVHTREFDADDLKKGLEFKPCTPGRALGSPQLRRWLMSRQAEYCPP